MSIINSMLSALTSDKQRGALLRRIDASKDAFLRRGVSPFEKLLVEPEVADSWLASKQAGVNPYVLENMDITSDEELALRKERNRDLLAIIERTLESHREVIAKMTSVVFFADADGVVLLLVEGGVTNAAFRQFGTKVGGIWSEEVTGTSAIALCVKHRTLIQLVGPEHYQISMQDHLTTAAPIFAEDGAFLGVVATTTLHNKVGSGLSHMAPYMIGWTLSLASSVENESKLQQHLSRDRSEYHDYLLKMVEGEGYAVVGRDGLVRDVMSGKMGSILDSWAPGSSIATLVDDGAALERAARSCRSLSEFPSRCGGVNVLVSLEAFEDRGCCVVSVRPLEPSEGDAEGVAHEATAPFERGGLGLDDLVGTSVQLMRVRQLARRAAESNVNVLVTGEPGVGKHTVARAIASSGVHRGDPVIVVSCSAIPVSSIEVELFGCEYEGSSAQPALRRGLLEQARDGVLLIEEVADIPRKVQGALLSAVEKRALCRVGGSGEVDLGSLQIIATTKYDTAELAREGRVREELLTALSVITVLIPPLRSRRDDIKPLISHLVRQESASLGRPVPRVSKSALELLVNHPLPGNVRQLANAIQYGILMSANGVIDEEALPLSLRETVAYEKHSDALGEGEEVMTLREAEYRAIMRALSFTGMNIRETARMLDVSRSTLYRKLDEYGVRYR